MPEIVELASDDLEDVIDDDAATIPNGVHPPTWRRTMIVLAILVLVAASAIGWIVRPRQQATNAEPPQFDVEPIVSPVVLQSTAPSSTADPETL